MGGRNPPSAQGNWAQVSSLPCPKALRGFSRQYPGPEESIPLTSELRGPLREDLSRPRQQGTGAAWLQVGLQKAFPVTGPAHMQFGWFPTTEQWSARAWDTVRVFSTLAARKNHLSKHKIRDSDFNGLESRQV